MSRTVAVMWHGSVSITAGVAYFFFVLPRWPEFLGDTSHTLGTVLRIVIGVLISLSALPVAFTLRRTRRPEFGTPALALRLHTSSIALHVLAGVLIIGAAISEIWLNLDKVGAWLFAVYGAAAANALLGIFAFYLAFVAELKPPPPKPLKPRKAGQGRRGSHAAEAKATADDVSPECEAALESGAGLTPGAHSDEEPPAETTIDIRNAEITADEVEVATQDEPDEKSTATLQQEESTREGREDTARSATTGGEESDGNRNRRRPLDKAPPTRRRKRSRGGGRALDD